MYHLHLLLGRSKRLLHIGTSNHYILWRLLFLLNSDPKGRFTKFKKENNPNRHLIYNFIKVSSTAVKAVTVGYELSSTYR